MIRYSILLLAVSCLCFYSFKDWYKTLCYSLPLLAFLERPDMPREMLGIPGLNPYNIILAFIILGWLLQKKSDESRQQATTHLKKYLILYLLIVGISFVRMAIDSDGLIPHSKLFNIPIFTTSSLIIDDFFNAWKWLVPGLLLCFGAVDKDRVDLAMKCSLIAGALLAMQIVLRMWPALIGLDDLQRRSMRVFDRDIGYHRGQLAPLMAACSWASMVLATSNVSKSQSRLSFINFILCSIALIATGGRGGMTAWFACGIVFGVLRWKKLFLFIPLLAVMGFLLIPSAKERLLSGFFPEDQYGTQASKRFTEIDDEGRDIYAITSGRNIVWPRVIEKITEAPFFGFGMRAYQREKVFISLYEDGTLPMGAGFHDHPHNAYLMLLLDMGFMGTILVLWFYFSLLSKALLIFHRAKERIYEHSISGFLLSYLIVSLVHGFTAGTFYPQQENVFLWCAIGLFIGTYGRNFGDQSIAKSNIPV